MTENPTLVLETARLKLVAETREAALASISRMSSADKAQLSPAWLALLEASAPVDPWVHGFSIVHKETRATIGSCGFKGPPNAEGMVEIAYGISPEHQLKGFATEAAEALTGYAFRSPEVRVVRAHTLPVVNASGRVLGKCGFSHVGEVIDPDDGLVWRWERQKEA